MPPELQPADEIELMRALITLAHEIRADLKATISQACQLSATMVNQFQEIHERETAQLQAHITAETKRATTEINKAVRDAHRKLTDDLIRAGITADNLTDTIAILFQRDQ